MNNQKVQCYGKTSAITIEAVHNTKNDHDHHTVNIDMTQVENGHALWQQKFIIQPSARELPLLCALFLGELTIYQLQRADKWQSFERQSTHIFMKGGIRSICALPISPGDCFLITDLLLGQLLKNSHCHSDYLLRDAIQSAARLYAKDKLADNEK